MPWRRVLLALLLSLVATGCAHHVTSLPTAPAPTLAGDSAHPAQANGWIETKLYFGLGPAGDPDKGISQAQWRAFLDKEVTPRFPAGLSVMDIYGQWQGKNQTALERERAKLLIIVHPNTPEDRAKIDAIRVAWKQLTGDQSVLEVNAPVDVSF